MKTKKQILNYIHESLELYSKHAKYSREKLQKNMNDMTGQQIMIENLFIADMESRAYAMKLLLEDIEEND